MSGEQDLGPPNAAPELLTPAQRNVELLDDAVSLRPAITQSKREAGFALRPYQREAIEATIKGFDEFRRQLIVCPTGGGKTLLFAKLAEHYQPGRTLDHCPPRGTPRTGARQDSAGHRYRGRDRGGRTHGQP